MLFFDNKLLLKYSGVARHLLASDRPRYDLSSVYSANADARDAVKTANAAITAYNSYANNTDPDALDAYKVALDARKVAFDAIDAAKAANDACDIDRKTAYEHAKLFKPFESISDAAFSAFSIISGPICLTLLALDEIVSFIVSSLKSIYNFVSSNPGVAKESGEEAVGHLLSAFDLLFTAAVSPVVNTVDFVGSCVTTLLKAMNPSSEGQESFGIKGDYESLCKSLRV